MRELPTQYGPIGILWFDTPEKITKAQSIELCAMIRQLQPDCIVNARIGNRLGDYGTTVDHVLAMAFDDPTMDDDLRETLAGHEIVLGEEWPDIWRGRALARINPVPAADTRQPSTIRQDAAGGFRARSGPNAASARKGRQTQSQERRRGA